MQFICSILSYRRDCKETFYKLTERNNMIGENYARQYGVTKDFCRFLISNEYKDIYYEDMVYSIHTTIIAKTTMYGEFPIFKYSGVVPITLTP